MILAYEIATAAFSDIESFFLYRTKFKVKRELFLKNMHLYASCKGSDENIRICLSNDFCFYETKNISDFMFLLLIVSHELAHYLNFHNTHKDQSSDDSVAIEARADHFGAQIFITLITFGKSIRGLLLKLETNLNQDVLINNIGVAVNEAYNSIFAINHSKKYPNPTHRVFIIIAGCLSFFNRFFNGLSEKWTMYFIVTIIHKLNVNDMPKDNTNISEVTENIHRIHKEIQRQQPLMVKGFKPLYGYFLTSDFDENIEQFNERKLKLEKMVHKWEMFN